MKCQELRTLRREGGGRSIDGGGLPSMNTGLLKGKPNGKYERQNVYLNLNYQVPRAETHENFAPT